MSIKAIKITCVILAIVLIGSIVTLYRNCNAFDEVMRKGCGEISEASVVVNDLKLDGKDTEKYEEAMRNYAIAVGPFIESINGISENALFYGKYNMPNFFTFMLEEVWGMKKPVNERKKCIEIIGKIGKTLEMTTELTRDYSFVTDPQDIASKITKIEALCEEWA